MRGKYLLQTILVTLFLLVAQTAWSDNATLEFDESDEVGDVFTYEGITYKRKTRTNALGDPESYAVVTSCDKSITDACIYNFLEIRIKRSGTSPAVSMSPVRQIEAGAFENCAIQKLELQESTYISSIGDKAFYNCTDLEIAGIPSTLETFGTEVFAYCNKLTSFTIYTANGGSDGTTALGTDHGILYFTNDEGRPVEILACAPLGLTEGRGNITDKNAVKRINAGAFEGCQTLTEIANYPLLEEIGDYAFKYCTNLQDCKLTASTRLTKIGISCFEQHMTTDAAENILTLADNSSLTYIPSRAFYGRNFGETFPVFSAVKEISNEAFRRAYTPSTLDLTSMVNLTYIGEYAFADNYYTETLNLPASLTNIAGQAFYGTNALKRIAFPNGSNLLAIQVNAFRADLRNGVKKDFLQMEFPESLTTIYEGAFAGTYFYTHYEDGEYSICIPKNVSSIGACAFSGHNGNIKNFVVDEENKYFTVEDGILFSKDMTRLLCCPISNGMIEGEGVLAKGLEGYIVPPSVQKIDADAFYCCKFPHIVLPSKLTYIDAGTFANCTNLKDITIPANVKAIADGAFYLCNSMKNMYFMPKTPPAMTDGLSNSYINHTLKYIYSKPDNTKGIYDPFGGFDCTLYTQLHVSGESSGENHPENYYKEKYADYIQTSENTFPVFKNVTNKIPFTMPSSGYITLGRDFDVILPSELTSLVAYTVTAFDPVKAQVTLTAIKAKEVSGEETRTRFIPARYPLDGYDHGYIGVILKGTPGSTYYYYMPRNDYSTAERMEPADDYKNLAYSNLVETYREPTYQNTYKFVLNGGKIRRVTKAGILGYNKAYLRLSKLQVEQMYANGLGAKGLNVVFEDGETTTIEYAKTNIASKEDNKYYNLSGQCVENPTKGIYIKNGKKIVIK